MVDIVQLSLHIYIMLLKEKVIEVLLAWPILNIIKRTQTSLEPPNLYRRGLQLIVEFVAGYSFRSWDASYPFTWLISIWKFSILCHAKPHNCNCCCDDLLFVTAANSFATIFSGHCCNCPTSYNCHFANFHCFLCVLAVITFSNFCLLVTRELESRVSFSGLL